MAARDKQSSRPVSEESVVASVTRRAGTAENQHALAGTQQDHVRTLLVLRTLGKNELEEIQGLLGQGLPSEIADDSAGKAVILSPARGRGTVIKALLSSGVVLDARGKSIESPPDGTPGQTPEELLDRFRKAGVRADLLLIAEPSSSEERGQMRQGAPRSSPGELPTASGMAKIQLLQAIRAGNLQMVEEILDTYELVPLSQ
jgi:hypothetical protein